MASALGFSRRGLVHAWAQRRSAGRPRFFVAVATLDNVDVSEIKANENTADRTAEASTSGSGPTTKARRVSPTLLKPDRIEDVQILENGVVLVDKPLGWTSFDVCAKIRNGVKFTGVKKVGHAGTLDPNASGLLIVCTGKGTKFSDDFMAESKEYSGTLRLGEGTASYDAECEVTERAPWEHISDSDLEAAAARFVGDIMQVPPMFSALKVGGQKLYELAREGQALELAPRPVTVSSFRLWRSQENRQDVHFHVACSKGTYIRSLAYDLGRALGSAAHLVALRREASGEFRVGDAWELRTLIAEIERHKQAAMPAGTEPQPERRQERGPGRRGGQGRRRRGSDEESGAGEKERGEAEAAVAAAAAASATIQVEGA